MDRAIFYWDFSVAHSLAVVETDLESALALLAAAGMVLGPPSRVVRSR